MGELVRFLVKCAGVDCITRRICFAIAMAFAYYDACMLPVYINNFHCAQNVDSRCFDEVMWANLYDIVLFAYLSAEADYTT